MTLFRMKTAGSLVLRNSITGRRYAFAGRVPVPVDSRDVEWLRGRPDVVEEFNLQQQLNESALLGNIARMPIGNVLQMLSTVKATGFFRVVVGEKTGFMRLKDGRLKDAAFDDKIGEDALVVMSHLEAGMFDFVAEGMAQPTRIDLSVEHLLMRAAQLADDKERERE